MTKPNMIASLSGKFPLRIQNYPNADYREKTASRCRKANIFSESGIQSTKNH